MSSSTTKGEMILGKGCQFDEWGSPDSPGVLGVVRNVQRYKAERNCQNLQP
jgi:hypothetical protein